MSRTSSRMAILPLPQGYGVFALQVAVSAHGRMVSLGYPEVFEDKFPAERAHG